MRASCEADKLKQSRLLILKISKPITKMERMANGQAGSSKCFVDEHCVPSGSCQCNILVSLLTC